MFISIFKNKHFHFIVLVVIGCYLIHLSLGNLNIHDVWSQLRQGNYWIAVPIMAVSIIGYTIRSFRWKLMLKHMGDDNLSVLDLYASLSIGYAVNMATPRLGEITRCLMLQKQTRVPFEKAVVSVFLERVVDVVCLVIIVVAAFWISLGELNYFVSNHILAPLMESISAKDWVSISLVAFFLAGMMWLVYYKLDSQTWVKKALQKVLDGFVKVFTMPQKGLFSFYTLCIWMCYFLMTYLWFDVFAETSGLGLREAFIIMAVGSVGRSVPIQGGGMGAYHYLVSNAFGLMGVSLLTGNAMALVIHGAQMLLTIFLGIIAWIWVLYKTEK